MYAIVFGVVLLCMVACGYAWLCVGYVWLWIVVFGCGVACDRVFVCGYVWLMYVVFDFPDYGNYQLWLGCVS